MNFSVTMCLITEPKNNPAHLAGLVLQFILNAKNHTADAVWW
ncbi:hypothetical protein [Acinetobacter bereziniae]|nr:hypothetical protein [Acinetobacter bereziniae]